MADRAQINAWMAAASEGDRTALEPLFAALSSASTRYAERLLGGDHALAQDCVQDALERLFGQLPDFDRARDGLAWALTLVTWSCRTARQRRAREHARAVPTNDQIFVNGLELAGERDLVREALVALGSLADADIETIIAMITGDDGHGLSAPTFRKRVERALARLRNAWRARHGSI